MRKLIMFITLIVSLATMILFSFSIEQLFSFFDLGTFDFDQILQLIQETPFEELAPILGVIMWGIFQLYGIPLTVFLVSLNGLASKN